MSFSIKVDPDTGNIYVNDGQSQTQVGTGGAALIAIKTIGPTGPTANRFIPAAIVAHPGDETDNSATWTEAENVTEVTIAAFGTSATTTDDYVKVVFDAPNGAVADTWLATPAFDQDGDTNIFVIPFGVPVVFSFASPLRRVDVEPTQIADISIGGA